jgi:hypothetical protein
MEVSQSVFEVVSMRILAQSHHLITNKHIILTSVASQDCDSYSPPTKDYNEYPRYKKAQYFRERG